MSFLTVEDINSILYEYGAVSIFHECDTSLISDTVDFTDVLFDFLKVSRTESNGEYSFTFEVRNKLWTGAYYFLDADGEYIDSSASYDSNVISLTTTNESVTLVLYLCNLAWEFSFQRLIWRPESLDFNSCVVKERLVSVGDIVSSFDKIKLIKWKSYPLSKVEVTDSDGTSGYLDVTTIDGVYYFDFKSSETELWNLKDVIQIDDTFYIINESTGKLMCPLVLFTDKLYLGKKNKVEFYRVIQQYYKLSSGVLRYNGVETSIDLTRTGTRTFELDLTERETPGNVKFSVHANSVNGNYDWDYDFVLPCEILKASSYSDLSSECGSGGATIVELDADFSLTGRISVTHDIKIIGGNHTLDLNGYGFDLSEGVNVTFENILFENGDTSIIQNKNTNLTLTGCSFTNCESIEYNNLGSVVYCEIDTDSLNNPNDFTTKIVDCTFIDNQNCILHGGQLSVKQSRLHNTDTDYIDKHNTAFLYQTDGNATLKHNIFDIDYDTDDLCSGELNIGFAQALVQCGLTARINGADSTGLLQDNSLPFSDNVYQNASHIFAKYYYPQIETCVYSSPVLDKEDKAVCYCVTGENWVFKQNVQVTRASWDSQNEIRKIEWEE